MEAIKCEVVWSWVGKRAFLQNDLIPPTPILLLSPTTAASSTIKNASVQSTTSLSTTAYLLHLPGKETSTIDSDFDFDAVYILSSKHSCSPMRVLSQLFYNYLLIVL